MRPRAGLLLTRSMRPAAPQAKVQEVQPKQGGEAGGAAGSVLLAGGQVVEYDWLVVALGAEADARGVPGVREHAVAFQSYSDAMRVGGVRAVGAGVAAGSELARPAAGRAHGRRRRCRRCCCRCGGWEREVLLRSCWLAAHNERSPAPCAPCRSRPSWTSSPLAAPGAPS
jgi:hypothetical protein